MENFERNIDNSDHGQSQIEPLNSDSYIQIETSQGIGFFINFWFFLLDNPINGEKIAKKISMDHEAIVIIIATVIVEKREQLIIMYAKKEHAQV